MGSLSEGNESQERRHTYLSLLVALSPLTVMLLSLVVAPYTLWVTKRDMAVNTQSLFLYKSSIALLAGIPAVVLLAYFGPLTAGIGLVIMLWMHYYWGLCALLIRSIDSED